MAGRLTFVAASLLPGWNRPTCIQSDVLCTAGHQPKSHASRGELQATYNNIQGSVRCPPYTAGDSDKNGRLGSLWGSTAASRIERDEVPGRPIWSAAGGELKPQ